MALRALLFCKNPDTTKALDALLKEAGIRAELCGDIFAAMEKGTKQPFSTVIVDWSEQPEAGFLLKRARESGLNRSAVAMAIVDTDPTPEEEREHHLDFLIYRPIVADEAGAVIAKASKQMRPHVASFVSEGSAALDHPELQESFEPSQEDPNLVSIASDLPESVAHGGSVEEAGDSAVPDAHGHRATPVSAQAILATALSIAALVLLWRSWSTVEYLKNDPEGGGHILRQSVAALFFVDKSGTQSVGTAMTDAQQDAYFNRGPAGNGSQAQPLRVVSSDIGLPDSNLRLRPAFDFPLPTPELHVDAAPVRAPRAVPESIRSSAPVSRPVVVAVNPQMLPVSPPPASSMPSWQQAGEPVRLTEDSARALALQTVNAEYPREALPQKLQGAVVLQVAIGRDGSVQELKLVRGYFVLAKAAIAAVKQWRFKPSVVNGRPVEAQTVITVNFTYPSS